jgi:hypothetical protein
MDLEYGTRLWPELVWLMLESSYQHNKYEAYLSFRLSLAYSFLFMTGRKINLTCMFVYTGFQIMKLRTCLWKLIVLN